jgi:hypothetical protein
MEGSVELELDADEGCLYTSIATITAFTTYYALFLVTYNY